ncbi:MAG: hypothetical protein FAZ92_02084 [Accumulibacter sp.]|nr:MAG: hypothetical protein FAZ92_02084 [Accumulibacter sp.]
MPIDISTLATTMSTIRKGMKMTKPIWNAVFSSLVTKAGISRRIGISAVDAKPGLRLMRTKSAISDSRVCLSMNSRSGTALRSTAALKLILSSDSGT